MSETPDDALPAGPITSLTNPRVKAAVRLRDRRERESTGLTMVDGARELLRALDAGVRVRSAFVAPDLLRSPDAVEAADRLRHRPGTVEASPAVLAKVAFGDRSDGIVAIVETPAIGHPRHADHGHPWLWQPNRGDVMGSGRS